MKLCRENQIWWSLEEEEKLPFLQNAIMESYRYLSSFIWLLADANILPVETELLVLKKDFEIEEIMLDGNRPKNSWGDVWIEYDIASKYAMLNDYENMYKHLHLAVKRAKDCDNRPDEEIYSALLVGDITKRRVDFDTADSRSLCEILRDKWLKENEFDCVRDNEEFRAILKELS